MGLEGKSVSAYPVAAEPGPQVAPIIVDSVIVISIGPYRQTPAPEGEDVVTMPAPLGTVRDATTNRADWNLAGSPSQPGYQPQCVWVLE